MHIEFHCPACNQRLRVPETAAGKQAKCPGCEKVNDIPMASTVASQPAAAPPPPVGGANPFGDGGGQTQDPANPFASPAPADGSYGHGVAAWPNPKMEATYAVSTAWNLFKENIGVILGGFVVIVVAQQAVNMIQQGVQIAALGGNQGGNPPPIFWVLTISFVLINQALQAFLFVGYIRILLEVARGRKPEFGMLFSGGRWFLRAFGGWFLYNLMVGIGMIALFVPGIYLALKYWPYLHFIVDQDCGTLNAFSRAGEATKNNMGEGFILALISVGLYILGFIMLCLGFFVTAPIASMAWTVSYLMLTAQPFKQQQRIA